MKILITGADGFIGNKLVNTLKKTKHQLFLCKRKDTKKNVSKNIKVIYEGNLLSAELDKLTKNIDIIIHCAAIVHKIYYAQGKAGYLINNTTLTSNLAKAGKINNIKKFIFLSTAGIHSDSNNSSIKISENIYINPKSLYTISKLKAENLLFEIFKNSNISLINLRPPAVYGDGVKGNLKSLIFLIKKRIPLPFEYFNINKRSYISIENLVDIIVTCIKYKEKVRASFLISDDNQFSTKELTLFLAKRLKLKVTLFKFPVKILYYIALILGKLEQYNRINNSFVLNTKAFNKTFNWRPKKK